MKKILIIGGCGYIGSMVTKKLKKKHRITIVDLNSYEHNIFENIQIIKINMKELTSDFINTFDVIVCLAGNSSVKSSNNIFSSIENNIENLTNLFKLINNKQLLIYASSSSIYGNTKNTIVNESHDNNTFYNYYDFSKKMLDMYTEIIVNKWIFSKL